MSRISWCKEQEKGIKLVSPNDNLSKEYFQNAEESLKVLRSIKGTESNMWLATTKYYTEYFAVYSVLMKIGIKCEIHDCTISLARLLEKEGVIHQGIAKTLQKDKELRIDNQYYLKNRHVEINFEKISRFIISVKDSLDKLNLERINRVRTKISLL
ncbi:hypothetical protein FJZ53_03190 [Candidatus Woesearchaeota archaeon]|nr:hypothetical protein [Candidatus Woesearchaeota archaeon]